MARPKKFRLAPEDVRRPEHARRLAVHVLEIELLRAEIDDLQQQVAEIYDDADGQGFDKKIVRKAVARRAKNSYELEAEESAVDAYTAAIEAGLSTRAREENPDHDPETGEIIESEPAHSEPSGVAAEGEGAAPGSLATQIEPSGNSGELPNPAAVATAVAVALDLEASADQSTAPRLDVGDNSTGEGARAELSDPAAATTPPAGEAPPVDTFPPGSIRRERTPAVGIVRHEVQRCFPDAWGMDAAALEDDIRANGIREPIMMQGNILLDGWSRFLAARELGIDYPVKEYDGDDPLADIIKANMASRSLNLAERVSIGRKLIKLAPEREADIADLLDLHQERDAA